MPSDQDYLANTWWHLLFHARLMHPTRMNDLAAELAAVTRVAASEGEAAGKTILMDLHARMSAQRWHEPKS